jgi:diguanylate cyclase (GGDEF)-like protein
MCVAIVDLDHFKQYNDRHGHQAGDRLLREASARWRHELRATDVLCRYGGEEFGLLLPGCDLETGEILMDRLRAAMPSGQTCSVGLTKWNGSEPPSALVARADRALYAAKRSGRNRVTQASTKS